MTTAPPGLLAARDLLHAHLGIPLAELGIVGDPAHRGGYHCGSDRVDLDDYSVRESPRDRAGLSEYASALDVGQFTATATVAGRIWTLRDFSTWLVAECQRGAPDTVDIREVIYSPDGRTVRRWDRLGRRTAGDDSHLTHTHISEHRDARGRRMPALFTRWLTHAGLAREDDMTPEEHNWLRYTTWRLAAFLDGQSSVDIGGGLGVDKLPMVDTVKGLAAAAAADETRDRALAAAVTALADLVRTGGGDADTAAILARIDQAATETGRTVTALQDRIADLESRLAAAHRAAADQLTG